MASTSNRARRRHAGGGPAKNVAIVVVAVVAIALAVWQGYRYVVGPQVVIAPGGPKNMQVTAESEQKPPPFGTPGGGAAPGQAPSGTYTPGAPGMEVPAAAGGGAGAPSVGK